MALLIQNGEKDTKDSSLEASSRFCSTEYP